MLSPTPSKRSSLPLAPLAKITLLAVALDEIAGAVDWVMRMGVHCAGFPEHPPIPAPSNTAPNPSTETAVTAPWG